LNEDQIKVENPSGPCIDGHEVGFLPGIIETKGRKIFLDYRGRKLSSSRLAITLNEVFVDSSSISRSGMDTEEDSAIRSKDLLFKDNGNEALCSWSREISSGSVDE
jgi:hypothetical protein